MDIYPTPILDKVTRESAMKPNACTKVSGCQGFDGVGFRYTNTFCALYALFGVST